MRLKLAVAMVVAAFAGCGGDGDDTAGPPPTKSTTVAQGQTSTPATTTTGEGNGGVGSRKGNQSTDPRTAVEAVLTSGNPADACARFVTEHYLRQAYGGRQGCIQAQSPAGTADRLDIKSVRIDDERATAVVVPSGGPYDGERVTVSLIRQDPGWAVDELDADVPVGP